MEYALQCRDKHDFGDEMRHLTSNQCNMSNIVDSAQDDNKICTVFSNKYNDFYNSVSYNSQDMKSVLNELNGNIKSSCISVTCKSSHHCTTDDVNSAIHRLKPHKADGVEDVSSDLLINGYHKLYVHLTLLFNIMLRHGVSPRNMLLSTLVPILKNRKKISK